MRRVFYGLVIWVLVLSACAAPAISDPTQPVAVLPATSSSPQKVTPSPFPTIAMPPTLIPSPTPSPTTIPFPTLVLPTATPYPDTPSFSIGESWEGREIWVWQFGVGPHTIVLVGGIHAGSEANTVRLTELLVSYFQRNPSDILPGVHLLIIPVANPDGLPRGNRLAGRLNAHQVDLNRNWGCEWSDDAYLRQTPVYPGPRPFSEAETLALRAFFLAVSPEAVLFYHSAAGGIFMGQCKDSSPGADWLGPLLAQATGYPQRRFTYYEVSGDATNWLAERGIPAAVVELVSEDSPEFDRNLAGVIALQCHFVLEDMPDARSDPAVQSLCPSE